MQTNPPSSPRLPRGHPRPPLVLTAIKVSAFSRTDRHFTTMASKNEKPSLGLRPRRAAQLWRRPHLQVIQRHLRARHGHLRRDHLPCHRGNEGQGRPRRGPCRRHAGRPGRRRALQGVNITVEEQAPRHRRNKTKTRPGAQAVLRRSPAQAWNSIEMSPPSPPINGRVVSRVSSVEDDAKRVRLDFLGMCTHGDRGKRQA